MTDLMATADPGPQLQELLDAATDEYALKVGRAALAWSSFQFRLRMWYSIVATPKDLGAAFREWDLNRSDSSQRKMLVKLVSDQRAQNPECLDGVAWVCEQATTLQLVRDAFVHATTVIHGLPEKAHVQFLERFHLAAEEDRLRAVIERPVESYDAFMADIAALERWLHFAFLAFTIPGKFGPCPARPELKAAALLKAE